MGKRGPKPKPTKLRLLDGNPSRRPINRDEPRPKGEIRMPEHLSQIARTQWTRIVESMPPGFYTPADEALLAAYSEAYADHVNASKALKDEESLLADGKANPLIAIRNQAARTMATLGTRLGLSPADRTNLKTPPVQEDSRWAGLIA